IGLIVASDTTGGAVSISINNKMVGAKQSIPLTGGAKKWTTVWFKNVSLGAGRQTLRVYADKGGFNFSAIRFDRTK
ncbi:MAG TPA: carbohydrate-binding domain-containing protein, partial [Flavisolibacter sp.]|nr:carbohydrate-binding domain-containing protein [Flavisolibacter sp.]